MCSCHILNKNSFSVSAESRLNLKFKLSQTRNTENVETKLQMGRHLTSRKRGDDDHQ